MSWFLYFFLKGHGVEQNETEAIKLFQMSAEQVQTPFFDSWFTNPCGVC